MKPWRSPAVKTWRPSPLVLIAVLTAAVRTSAQPVDPCNIPELAPIYAQLGCKSFKLAQHTVFIAGGLGTLPPDDSATVFTAMPNRDGGNTWEVYDDGGAPMSTTQGTATAFGGNRFGGRSMLDVSDSSHPFVSDARVRAMFLGDWTIICAGFATTRGSATSQTWLDQYDGTHEVTLYSQGSAFRVSNDGTSHFAASDTAYDGPRDGEAIVWGRQSGNTLCAGTMDVASETNCITHSPPAAMSSGHLDFGAFPAPFTGNAMRGNLHWCKAWATAESASFIQSAVWKWQGISHPEMMLSPTLMHNVPQLEGEDNTATTGFVDVMKSYSVMVNVATGASTSQAYTNFANATPIDVSAFTTVNSPTIAANLITGPFGRRLNTTPCGRITKSGAVAGVITTAVPNLDGGSAGSGWYNATAFLARGDAGTNISHARIQWVFSGSIDGGNADVDGGCEIAGLTDVALRYPQDDAGHPVGCRAYFVNPSNVQFSVLVNDGSLFDCQEQETATFQVMRPTIDNGSKGVGFIALDGGSMTSGAKRGGLGVVVQLPFTIPSLVNTDPRAVAAFFEDAFASANPGHIVTHNYGAQAAGLQLLAIMYGPNTTQENYLLTNESIPAFTWFRPDIQWKSVGSKCIAQSHFRLCPDQSNPQTCTIGPVVNTGTAGECPNQIDTVYIGNRYDNTDNANVNFAVYDVWK